jgi:hypothetical protein
VHQFVGYDILQIVTPFRSAGNPHGVAASAGIVVEAESSVAAPAQRFL